MDGVSDSILQSLSFTKLISVNSAVSVDSGALDFELFYDAALKEVGVALNTATLSASYMFSVFEGFWTYLGVSWNSVEQYIGMQL